MRHAGSANQTNHLPKANSPLPSVANQRSVVPSGGFRSADSPQAAIGHKPDLLWSSSFLAAHKPAKKYKFVYKPSFKFFVVIKNHS